MHWSVKDALLAEFSPRFNNPILCEQSLNKYIRTAQALDDDRARQWLERDLARDKELAAIADPDDVAVGPSRYELNGCYHCYGRGFVRKDVDIHDPAFGRAYPCPVCAFRQVDPATHCTAKDERNQCYGCRQLEDESAGPTCRNPKWHLPNWQSGHHQLPPLEPGEQRDYIAELAKRMNTIKA